MNVSSSSQTRRSQVDIRLRVKGGGFTGQIYALRQALPLHFSRLCFQHHDFVEKRGYTRKVVWFDTHTAIGESEQRTMLFLLGHCQGHHCVLPEVH